MNPGLTSANVDKVDQIHKRLKSSQNYYVIDMTNDEPRFNQSQE